MGLFCAGLKPGNCPRFAALRAGSRGRRYGAFLCRAKARRYLAYPEKKLRATNHKLAGRSASRRMYQGYQ